jgi:hypothetical protein
LSGDCKKNSQADRFFHEKQLFFRPFFADLMAQQRFSSDHVRRLRMVACFRFFLEGVHRDSMGWNL